jgi:spore germination protein KA
MGKTEQESGRSGSRDQNRPGASIGEDLRETVSRIKVEFGESSDLVVNFIKLGGREDCANAYFKGLADAKVINDLSLELTQFICEYRNGRTEKKFELLMSCFSGLRSAREGADYEDACRELLAGQTVFFLDGCGGFLSVNTKSNEGRAISEPTSQNHHQGAKDSFTENIDQNVYLIRKRLRNKNLRVEPLTAGEATHTELRLVYMNGIARAEILQEIRRRLSGIRIDRVLEGNYVEEYLKDDKYTIFPELLNSEKPDSVVAPCWREGGHSGGRHALRADGPALAIEFIRVSEDYYHLLSSPPLSVC